jgi:hypothetical protein
MLFLSQERQSDARVVRRIEAARLDATASLQ